MRILSRVPFVIVLVLSLAAQGNRTASQQKIDEMLRVEKAKAVLTELQKFEYTAKMDIPAVDCIFVEDGKLAEGMYQSYLQDNPKALKAGSVTKVTSVKVMEKGIQIFMGKDSFAIIGFGSSDLDTKEMAVKDLVEMAKKSISPLLQIGPEEEKGKEK